MIEHLVFLLEEPSQEAALTLLLPKILGNRTFELHQFGSKDRLLKHLEKRLSGYASWLPPTQRIVVVVDRDDDDCLELKEQLVEVIQRTKLRAKKGDHHWQVAVRIAVEELEAWFFGDWEAVEAAFPGVPTTIPKRKGFRDPDDIRGGTWEALERILQEAGYFEGGLRKIELARLVSEQMQPARNRSNSFRAFASLLTTL